MKTFLTKTQILTHRGLEPSQRNFFSESSLEAFTKHLSRGFGLEFDVNFTKDGKIIIVHDASLERISGGVDKRIFSQEISSSEIPQIKLKKGRIAFFKDFAPLIRKNSSRINALHLKGRFQQPRFLSLLFEELDKNSDILEKILVFDVTVSTAAFLKKKIPNLHLAPSIAHPYDIERYNSYVKGTLISLEEAIKNRNLYDWVWLDEWDRADRNGEEKKLYTQEVFEKLRTVGYQISLVTPELHATSPGLYGGESHQDAKDKASLFQRIKEIVELGPDALCTDYPEEVLKLI